MIYLAKYRSALHLRCAALANQYTGRRAAAGCGEVFNSLLEWEKQFLGTPLKWRTDPEEIALAERRLHFFIKTFLST